MRKKFTILTAALALLAMLAVPTGGWGQTTLTTDDLNFGTPQVSENFNSLSIYSATAKIDVTNYTSNGVFNKMYNNKTDNSNSYAIDANTTFGANALKLTAGSGSPLIAGISKINNSSISIANTGAFSIKIAKSDNSFFGFYGAESDNSLNTHDKCYVYLKSDAGVISIHGTNKTWTQVGDYSSISGNVIEVCVVYNNSNSATTYGNNISLASKTAHVFINGSCVMNAASTAPKDFTILGGTLSNFRVGPQVTSGYVCTVDDVVIYNALPTAASTDPSINADNVNITYNATGGNIAYTVNNAVSGGTLTAAIKGGTTPTIANFTLGTVGTTVPFSCNANTVAEEKTATVTLTYTYNTNEHVTKDVTVTQAPVPTYTVTYNGNGSTGGSVPTDTNNPYLSNSDVTVLGVGNLVKTGHSFVEWNTDAEGNGTSYDPDDTFAITENTTLYAQWLINNYSFTLNVEGDDPDAVAELRVGGQTVTGNTIEYGKTVTVYVVVSEGYEYTVSVMAGNTAVSFANNTFTMPDNNVTVTVNTILDPYSYTSLTGDDMSSMANVGTTYNTIKSITTSDGFYWETNGYQAGGTSNPQVLNMIQLRLRTNNNGVSYIKLPEFNGKIEKIVFSVTNASATSSSGEAYKGVLGFQESNKKDANVIKQGGDSDNGMKTITLDLSDVFYGTGFIVVYSGNAVRIWNIDVTYLPYSDMEGATLSSLANNVAVSIPSTTTAISENLTIPASSGILVKSGASLTVSGTLTNSGNANNLIIEDGGQLISNSAVAATMQKTITAYDQDAGTGWYFIASPMASTEITNTAHTNILDDNSDLYRFNQSAELEWENYRAQTGGSTPEPLHSDFTTLVNGKGYLYANSASFTALFMGTLANPSPGEVPVTYDNGAQLKGWNLVGNPFSCNAYLSGGYYVVNGAGNPVASCDGTAPIAPCTGAMVQVASDVESITFSKSPTAGANNSSLQMTVGQQTMERGSVSTVDNAIVSFNEGNELPKFYFGNANANLYIPQGEKEYAIATSEGQGEMPLNFRANTDGQYTLTVNPEGVEMNYLHLIDNMTGNDVDLLATPSYTFNATTRDYESRFRLVFATNNENGVSAGSTTFAFYSNGNWMVNNEGEASLQVIDVMGRVLSNQTISGTAELSLNQQPGVYVLRLVNGNDVKTQKIVVR